MRLFVLAIVAGLFMAPQVSSAQFDEISLSVLMHARMANATVTVVRFRGSPAFSMIPNKQSQPGASNQGPLAILDGTRFRNGSIDVDLSGTPAKGADESVRGFIGIAFRVQSDSRFEIIYLRPTNSTANDQLRRNHTTQYSAEPDWPWDRLRGQAPGVYESWADIEPGQWTHVHIVVHGTNAELFVNRAKNPCLIVRDLKLGDIEGSVGLWMGRDTEGYFRNLRISVGQ